MPARKDKITVKTLREMDPDALLTEKQVAATLNLEPQTLSKWRLLQTGTLPYVKLGRSVRYRVGDLCRPLRQFDDIGRIWGSADSRDGAS